MKTPHINFQLSDQPAPHAARPIQLPHAQQVLIRPKEQVFHRQSWN